MTSREDGVEDAVDEVGPGRSGYRGNNEMSFPRMLVHSCFLGMAALVCGGTLLTAEEVQFHRYVEPIFAAQCLTCHGPDRQRSGLRLDLRGSLLRGGDYGQPSIVPGRPQNSLLMAAVSDPDSDLRMPPDGPGLTKTQINTLRRCRNRQPRIRNCNRIRMTQATNHSGNRLIHDA